MFVKSIFTMDKYYLADMTSAEAAQAVKEKRVIIVPVGAIHKHGDGPIGTDVFSCTELARRVGETLHDKVIVVPTLPYGVSNGSVLPGGIDTSYELVKQLIQEICFSFTKYGSKHFLFLSGHGGNDGAYLAVASELNKRGALAAHVRWWDLIIQLKGDINPNYRNVNILEQSVDAACGKNDPSIQRDGETRTENFGLRLRNDVFGDRFTYPNKMTGTVICAGSDPVITRIPYGVIYDGGVVQIPLPSAHIDVNDPEPGDWPSIADKVTAEQGNDILNTCRDWIVKFLDEFVKLEIPDKYIKN
jgi:creatinine amidohydrolase